MRPLTLLRVLLIFAPLALPAWSGAAPERRAPPVFDKRTGLYEQPLDDLRRAAGRGDRGELARIAGRVGPARLARALTGEVELARAALDAIPLVPGAVRLIEPVAATVGKAALTVDAARTLGRLLDGADPRQVGDWEIPADALSLACGALARVATDPTASPTDRVACLEALAEAGNGCSTPLAQPLRDASPEVRRAAALATMVESEPLRQLLEDAEPAVAAAAGVALCRSRVRAGKTSAAPEPLMRKVALAAATPVEDVAEILPCLTRSPEPADRKAAEAARRARGDDF